MKKLFLAAIALMIVASTASPSYAQLVRVGGGLITKGSIPGGGIATDIKLAGKPFAIGITAEYYSKSGTSLIPIGASALYHKTAENEKVTVFFGGGGGIARSKSSFTVGATTVSATSTKGMVTGQGGVIFHASPKVGLFAKGQYYRVFSTPASNQYSIMGGLSFTLMPMK